MVDSDVESFEVEEIRNKRTNKKGIIGVLKFKYLSLVHNLTSLVRNLKQGNFSFVLLKLKVFQSEKCL